MNTYTVVLLYPDYLTRDFGADVLVLAVVAKDVEAAVATAQQHAVAGQVSGVVRDPQDFRMILVLAGNVDVVADATSL